MEKITDAKAIRMALQSLAKIATGYFQKAEDELANVQEPNDYSWSARPEPEFYWSQLTAELQSEATKLIKQLYELFPMIATAVERTPALTIADQREIGSAVKKIRAAMRFRRYLYSEIEVLHDEGIVLGVQPPSQSEDKPLDPKSAAKVFAESINRLEDIVELVSTTAGSTMDDTVSTSEGATSSYRRGTAFIMMWMDKSVEGLEDVSDTVKRCFNSFGIKAVRSDDIQHEDLITKRILDEIKTAEFLFADLTGERPSVYYEVGYAHAIGRRVILFRKGGTPIHFDLAGYNCPEYKNLGDLERQLEKRLQFVTGEKPKSGRRRAKTP